VWRGRNDAAVWSGMGGVYSSESLDDCLRVLQRADREDFEIRPRCFGVVAFDTSRPQSSTWAAYPRRRFWIPRVLTRFQSGKAHSVSLQCRGETARDSDLTPGHPEPARERQPFTRRRWREAVVRIHSAIADGEIRKAVLARHVVQDLAESIRLPAVLETLAGRSADSHCFAYRPHPGNLLFGASPECLFARSGKQILVDSLAGTRPRVDDTEQDDALRTELLTSVKDLDEQGFVTDYVQRKLESCCTGVTVDEAPHVRQFQTVQHLYATVRGTLRDSISVETVLDQLHPTPAVCGVPGDAARDLIAQLEPESRGLYAGAIGWADGESAEFAVAIRCGLLHRRQVTLFAGAGIVAESDADNEFDECEWKLQTLRDVITP